MSLKLKSGGDSMDSIINTTDIFHEDACERINKKYNTFGIDSKCEYNLQ